MKGVVTIARGSFHLLKGPRNLYFLSVLFPPSIFVVSFADWPEGFTDTDSHHFEQHITIVPNPRANRRRSMADYAFPELHSRSKAKEKEPENLLILTRSNKQLLIYGDAISSPKFPVLEPAPTDTAAATASPFP